MPSQTFFNLPEDKQRLLVKALEKEFSRVPLSKSSIANIVKTAGIPRGSFYQYFDGKEDCFFFILNELAKKRRESFIAILTESNGDIFEAIVRMYQYMLEQMTDDHQLNLLKNTFLNMTYKIENVMIKIFSDHHLSGQYVQIHELIDKQRLNLTTDTDLYRIMQILSAVFSHNFVEKFTCELTNQEAIERFMKDIHLLKRGLMVDSPN